MNNSLLRQAKITSSRRIERDFTPSTGTTRATVYALTLSNHYEISRSAQTSLLHSHLIVPMLIKLLIWQEKKYFFLIAAESKAIRILSSCFCGLIPPLLQRRACNHNRQHPRFSYSYYWRGIRASLGKNGTSIGSASLTLPLNQPIEPSASNLTGPDPS